MFIDLGFSFMGSDTMLKNICLFENSEMSFPNKPVFSKRIFFGFFVDGDTGRYGWEGYGSL